MFKFEDGSEPTEFSFSNFTLPGDLSVVINQRTTHRLGPTGFLADTAYEYSFQDSSNLQCDAMGQGDNLSKVTLMSVVDPFGMSEREKLFVKEVCVSLICLGRSDITYFNAANEVCSFPFEHFDIDISAVLGCFGEAAVIAGSY